MPEPYRSRDWALVPAITGLRAEYKWWECKVANLSSDDTETNHPYSNIPCNITAVWRGKHASNGSLDHKNARIHDHGLNQRHFAVGKSKQQSLPTAKLQQSEWKWGDRETQSLEISVYRLAATYSKQTSLFLSCFHSNYTKQELFNKPNSAHALKFKTFKSKDINGLCSFSQKLWSVTCRYRKPEIITEILRGKITH